jgi:hypothetical protein
MEPQHDSRNNATLTDLDTAFQSSSDITRDEGARAAVGGRRPADREPGRKELDAYTEPMASGLPPAHAKKLVNG